MHRQSHLWFFVHLPSARLSEQRKKREIRQRATAQPQRTASASSQMRQSSSGHRTPSAAVRKSEPAAAWYVSSDQSQANRTDSRACGPMAMLVMIEGRATAGVVQVRPECRSVL
jgi:hypothetical protein